MALVVLWTAFLTFLSPAPSIPVPADLNQLDSQLREYVLEKVEWVRQKPRNADRHSTLALTYGVNGLWLEARAAFENAARLNPAQPLARMYVGVAAQELGTLDDALKIFRETATNFPDFAPGQYRLGTLLLRVGNVDEAESAFERLTALAPQEWRGHAGLGEVKLKRGLAADAAKLLERAIQLEPRAKSAHYLLGQAYRALGRTEDAELELGLGRNATNYPMPDAWSETALTHSKLLQAQIEMANDLSEEGQPRKAVEVLAKAFVYHPDNVGLMNQLAIALHRSDQPNKARAVLQELLQKDPRSVPGLVTLSLAQQRLEEHEPALATAERAIALAPDLAQPYVAKANALLAMERDDDALEALRTAARLDPQNADVLIEMGDILWRNLNRLLEAKQQYNTARRLNPALAAAYVRLADLHVQLGELNEAQEALDKLTRVAPKNPDLPILRNRLGAAKEKTPP